MRHPNIVSVHAAGEIDGQLYYVMDYLPGETLRQRLSREKRLPPDAVIRIGSDIADALDAASQAGVVHRDLKPENILLEGSVAEPRALLADFGIARLVEGGGGHTDPGTVAGGPRRGPGPRAPFPSRYRGSASRCRSAPVDLGASIQKSPRCEAIWLAPKRQRQHAVTGVVAVAGPHSGRPGAGPRLARKRPNSRLGPSTRS